MSRPSPLPAEPLVRLVAVHGGLTALLGPQRTAQRHEIALARAFERAKKAGRLSVVTADELAVRLLGVHPALVWGEAWWDDEPPQTTRPAKPAKVLELWRPADGSCRPGRGPCHRQHRHRSGRRSRSGGA